MGAGRLLIFGVVSIALAACDEDAAVRTEAAAPDAAADVTSADVTDADAAGPEVPLRPLRILFFTKETLYFHTDAHAVGDVAVPTYLESRGHTVTVSSDTSVFSDAGLAPFDVVLFFVTSGNFFDDGNKAAFQSFITSGHGFAGVHSASITEYDWPFFTALVGATFWGHGVAPDGITDASVVVAAPSVPLVSFLPRPWVRTDEWYYFTTNPADNHALEPLLTLDESTLPSDYPDAGFTGDHPLSWRQTYQGGRSFYTAMGHTGASYTDDLFLATIALGVEWAGAPSSVHP